MTERLNTNDDQETRILREKHAERAERVINLEASLKRSEALKAIIGEEYNRGAAYQLNVTPYEGIKGDLRKTEPIQANILSENLATEILRQATRDYKSNLWDAHEHKEQHLDQYIKTAHREAEVQGISVNLEQTQQTIQSQPEDQKH